MNNLDIYNKVSIIFISIISILILFTFFGAVVFVVFSAISHFLPQFMPIGMYIIYTLTASCIIIMLLTTISIILNKDISIFISMRYFLMKYVVQVAKSLSKRIKLDSEKTIRTYINLNNNFLINHIKNKASSKIMLLLPHCIQLHTCSMKLTYDIKNCKMCGKCAISNLIELSEKFNVNISVASGGTMARKQVADLRPDVIMAVACERDLLSGIRDTLPMNVIGVLNSRPNGHCLNTTVNIDSILYYLEKLKSKNK